MVFALALKWVRRYFKKALDGKPCTIEIQILHKNEAASKKWLKHLLAAEKNIYTQANICQIST